MNYADTSYEFNRKKIEEIYAEYGEQFINNIASIIEPSCPVIADKFYEIMLANGRAVEFLDSKLVNNRLRGSMTLWIHDLFVFRKGEAIDRFIARQKVIGDVHERINMPMLMLDYGMLVIKEEINQLLQQSLMNRENVSRGLIFVSKILDYTTVIINESFVDNSIDHKRRSDLLQTQSINANLAYECAQLRTALAGWFCSVLMILHKLQRVSFNQVDIWQSNIGMWLRHKAKTIFVDNEEIRKIEVKLDELNEDVKTALLYHNNRDWENLVMAIEKLDLHIKETDWLIGSIEKIALEQEKGKDALTNLFNRRYLPNIIKSEMKFNQRKNTQFAIIFIDIDNFKQINDNYGHDKGDYVVNEVSYLLLHSVRVGDYVFRYEGEEFLVLLTESNSSTALEVAEKLRAKVASHPFSLEEGSESQVTLSMGVAMSGKEKDFEKIIRLADKSLLVAKETGKNRCVMSQDSGELLNHNNHCEGIHRIQLE